MNAISFKYKNGRKKMKKEKTLCQPQHLYVTTPVSSWSIAWNLEQVERFARTHRGEGGVGKAKGKHLSRILIGFL